VTRIEDLLREQLRSGDAPAGPGRDVMLARVGRVRRRRMAAAGAGFAAILAAVVAVGLSVMRPGPSGTQFGSDVPPRVYTADLVNAVFTDARHGYVVQESCSTDVITDVPDDAPTPDVHRRCAGQLLATADAGQTWQARALPGDPAVKDAAVDLVPGHSLMLWVDGTGRLALGGYDLRYWTTTDGGATWQESATPRDTGPAGSLATFTIDDRLTFLGPPPDGVPLKKSQPSPAAATDGSFWTACAAGPCVRVTRDHGATWQRKSVGDGAASVDWVASYNGHTVYAAVRTDTHAQLVRSTDGGATWSHVLDLEQPSANGLVLPDGDLILVEASDTGDMSRLASGATQLHELADAPAHPSVLYLSGGVVVAAPASDAGDGPELASLASVSTDGGTTWIAVPPPPA